MNILDPMLRTFARLSSCALIASTLICASTGAATAASSDTDSSTPTTGIVKTDSGPVSGIIFHGVQAYLGIPFAAPPVGPLRWMPPQAPASWQTPLAAEKFGKTCPQSYELGVFASPSTTEDCLYLNVFTQLAAIAHGAKRPVMVWIHGGGFFDGESDDYDASKLVRAGTVVVSFNYRLGLFGFFAHPALDKEGHTFANYGLMDQQYALQWVRLNIAAFGGDPDNVTIFGESAGGAAVIANLMSPLSAGLFHQGISESGGYIIGATGGIKTLDKAEAAGTKFAAALGCTEQSADCLRRLSVEQILKIEMANLQGLVVDGSVLPLPPKQAFQSGHFNHVPFINGNNRDEWRWAVGNTEYEKKGKVLSAADYPAGLAAFYGADLAPRVQAVYPLSDYSSPSEALGAAETDSLMACPGRKLSHWTASQTPTYAYEFADRTAPAYMVPASFSIGAGHTLELQYLFPQYHGGQGTPHPLSAAQQKLSDTMVGYWTTFWKARHGKGPWQQFDAARDNYLSLQLPHPQIMAAGDFAQEHKCGFWDIVGKY
ncbi:MAG: carboxylesterase/lipase family protein [Janthinobacterium lividum]